MKITFALKEFFQKKDDNLRLVNHFLLGQARVQVRLVFEDSTEKVFAAKRGLTGKFTLDLLPVDIPDFTVGPGPAQKKKISSVSMDFLANYYYGAKTFQLIRILQEFSVQELPTNNDVNVDYALSPFAWKHSAFSFGNSRTSRLRKANGSVHPLLDLTKLSQNLIVMNALVLDLTDLWDYLHEQNENYQFYKELTPTDKMTFKVFAHLGGNSFLWFGVVPTYLNASSNVSPHVFYMPGDLGEKQNVEDEYNYLFGNYDQRDAKNLTAAKDKSDDPSNDFFNGNTLLLQYLLPPIDDEELRNLKPKKMNKDTFEYWIVRRRNVVGFERPDSKPREIVTLHWNIGAGLQRAFYGLRKKKPQQFLLIPQPFGPDDAHSRRGNESDRHLKSITDTIVDLLQTNTLTVAHGDDDELVAKDKLVLSCYSASASDLWNAISNNPGDVKAIICIEPSPMNPQGRDLIPPLLKKNAKVFIIGRHVGKKKKEKWTNHYRPEISAQLQAKIKFLPKNLKVLHYAPVPQSSDFVKFRVARVTKVKLDPLMLDEEKDILEDLASGKKPITGDAAIEKIFKDLYNVDPPRPPNTDYADIMYTHSFALTGGDWMKLSDPDDFYDKPVEYLTFFQTAVEEIG